MSNEITEQGRALAIIAHGDKKAAIAAIEKYAADLRQIINEFKAKFGRCPSCDDLIWCESCNLRKDITKD